MIKRLNLKKKKKIIDDHTDGFKTRNHVNWITKHFFIYINK